MNSPILKYDQFLNHKTLTESRRTLMVNIFNQFEDVKNALLGEQNETRRKTFSLFART